MAALWECHFGGTRRQIRNIFRTTLDKKHAMIIHRPGDRKISGQVFWQDCLFQEKKVACLYSLCVQPPLQHQGLGTELMEAVHVHLKQQGYSAVVLEPQEEELFWFYHYFGYEWAGGYDSFFVKAEAPVDMKAISPEEYHQLRREYLPENGLERPLTYFKSRRKELACYQGEGFICAVERGEPGRCLELLGDISAAGGIAGYLGKPHMKFYTPGGEQQNLMLLDFAGDMPTDLYLGFPLD